MPGNSPELRPLTIAERHITWLYGIAPSSLIYCLLVAITYLLVRPEVDILEFYMSPTETPDPVTGQQWPINVQMILARAFYFIAYFTWGRSTGHLAVGAHVIDRKTGRRMRTWQKIVRGSAQVFAGSMYIVLDAISLLLVLLDRQERRSAYDWLAGTVVVKGELPPEEEAAPARSWFSGLARALRGHPLIHGCPRPRRP